MFYSEKIGGGEYHTTSGLIAYIDTGALETDKVHTDCLFSRLNKQLKETFSVKSQIAQPLHVYIGVCMHCA
jgi:hypothetical protein